jgi:hypothetical protein
MQPANKSLNRTATVALSVLSLAISFKNSAEWQTLMRYHYVFWGKVASAKPSLAALAAG